MALNFPFYMYPGAPVSGYMDTSTYHENLFNLYNFLETTNDRIASTKRPTFLHISIGAALDEQWPGNVEQIGWQYQQLYPYHLEQCYKFTQLDIIHIIISPNENFDNKNYIDPCFIENTKHMNWRRQQIGIAHEYISSDSRYSVLVFCTPLPHVDNRNEKLIEKIRSWNTSVDVDYLVQTEYDRHFTKQLYSKMRQLFDTVNNNNGFVTCFSFAVFRKGTEKDRFCNYVMFSEIIALFEQKTSQRILAEWLYTDGCYVVSDYRSCELISYIRPDKDKHDGSQIILDHQSLQLVPAVSFISESVNDPEIAEILEPIETSEIQEIY